MGNLRKLRDFAEIISISLRLIQEIFGVARGPTKLHKILKFVECYSCISQVVPSVQIHIVMKIKKNLLFGSVQ